MGAAASVSVNEHKGAKEVPGIELMSQFTMKDLARCLSKYEQLKSEAGHPPPEKLDRMQWFEIFNVRWRRL